MEEDDLNKFNTTLKRVLTFIKYSKDADKLEKALERDPSFRQMGREEVDVLNVCTNTDLRVPEGEVTLDMCEAIQTLNQRAADEAAEKARIA